ncbi:hypothetical protein PBI_CAMILLE_8 [Microbacterium phage Camille]|nr:hypothetical protein PBI_CAMILLE_8 [Microbacterium phage Camille]
MADATEQIDNSILHDIKQMLGQEWDDTTYDLDMKILINGIFFNLHQVGVGPSDGFQIEDHTTLWSAFTGVTPQQLNAVKEYIFLRAKLAFDPGSNGFLITNLEKQADKLEWTLMVSADPPVPQSVLGEINE